MNRYIRKILFVIIICTLVFALTQNAVASDPTDFFVTTSTVRLRSGPSTYTDIITLVEDGTRVQVVDHDPAGWSSVRINGTAGFIRSDLLTFPVENMPITFRTTTGVNLRAGPTTESVVFDFLPMGTDVEVLEHDPAGWSNVRSNGITGFVRSDFLRLNTSVILQQTIDEASPAPAQTTGSTFMHTVGGVNLRAGPSTETDILTVLNSGTRVEVLNNNPNGWSSVRINERSGYIRSDFLSVSSGHVELLSWSEARNLIRTGTDIPVTDVRTGRTFTVRAFSLGGHADVEPVTQRDTDTIFDIRGGTWSWSARPVWVTIGGRTVAASINGMPHGGSTISGNGMNGHLCLHFHGTVTNNQRYQADLRSAVMEAYNSAR
ncbi:MAG: SH3 domain-containing protein [Oscillospiraceae bacterium]|nr:SH3 domain-containing protein [Oscillospiraceae bacterium]